MSKQKYSYDDLLESIYSEHTINCDGCKAEMSEFNTDEYMFAERLFKLGWRVIKEVSYCPNCVYIKLQNKSK